MDNYDLIVIGSGPGGYKAALNAAHLGARVALVEKALPGGTCLNQGCIPKKTLVYLAGMIEDVNALNGRGIQGEVRGDFGAALAHKDEVITGIRKNFPVWLKRLGIKVYTGHARLRDPRTVDVEPTSNDGVAQQLCAQRIIIATGATPRSHPACPRDGQRIITSRDFMFSQQTLPRSILFVGGGAIGVELGYMLRQFGAEVTIAEDSGRLLNKPCISERASNLLERKFKRLGVEVLKNTTVSRSEVTEQDVGVVFSDGSQARFEQVMVAIGRRPHTRDLGLENAGVALDANGFITTNEYLETSTPGIYAIGDVKFGPMTANGALHDAKVAATNAMTSEHIERNYNRVPIVIDSALEIASVGLTEDRAEDAGFEPDVARASFGGSAKALGRHDYEGFIEVVHDEETGQLLGGCIVGPEAGEQIHMLTAACQSHKGLWFLKDISYSHPSWCEELETAIDPYTAAFLQSGKELFRPGIYATNE